MTASDPTKPSKSLGTDLLMLLVFLLLLVFALWVAWMYFLRGPIDIETRGFVTRTLKETVVQPVEKEKYTLQHFHNMESEVLAGIGYKSTCVGCHGDYPHNKTLKVRAFYNAHSWFVACEVCHRKNENQQSVVYQWLDNTNDKVLSELQGEPGIYNARIVPLIKDNGLIWRLDDAISQGTINAYDLAKRGMNEEENKQAIKEIHQPLSEKMLSCEQCHSSNGLLDFEQLLYSGNMALHLKSIDSEAMISGYEVFHLPNVYGTQ